jgi:hypothetical protein
MLFFKFLYYKNKVSFDYLISLYPFLLFLKLAKQRSFLFLFYNIFIH